LESLRHLRDISGESETTVVVTYPASVIRFKSRPGQDRRAPPSNPRAWVLVPCRFSEQSLAERLQAPLQNLSYEPKAQAKNAAYSRVHSVTDSVFETESALPSRDDYSFAMRLRAVSFGCEDVTGPVVLRGRVGE